MTGQPDVPSRMKMGVGTNLGPISTKLNFFSDACAFDFSIDAASPHHLLLASLLRRHSSSFDIEARRASASFRVVHDRARSF
jgi:hypothetical protein